MDLKSSLVEQNEFKKSKLEWNRKYQDSSHVVRLTLLYETFFKVTILPFVISFFDIWDAYSKLLFLLFFINNNHYFYKNDTQSHEFR